MSEGRGKPTIGPLRRRNRITKKIQRTLAEQAVQGSEKLFRTMADATPVMIWRSGPDTGCTYFNAGWLQFTGQTMEHELGDGWSAGVHPEDLRQCLDTYISAFEQRKPFAMEYRLRHCSGEYRWILDRGAPLYGLDGTFLGYAGGCIDIHAHKLAEQELRNKQEQLRKTLEFTQAITANMGEALYTLDTAGLITYVNRAAERLFGWPSTEMIGRKMHDMIHYKQPDGRPFPGEDCPVLRVLESGMVLWNQEDIFIRKDGSFLNVSYNSSPIRSEDGAVVGLVVVFRDITAQKRAEERLRRGSEWFKSIIENTQDAVISINRDGRIVLFNPAAERIFGYTRAEIEGQNVSILMADLYAQEHDNFVDWYERTSEAHIIGRVRTVEGRRKNGEVFPIELSVAETKVHNDVRYSAFIRDISERVRTQAEVETRARQHAAAAELGRRALAVTDLPVLMNEACILVREALGTEFCMVLQLLPEREGFSLIAGVGWEKSLVGKVRVPVGAESQAGYTILVDEPVVVEDLSRETRFGGSALLHDHGIVSGMSIPIPGVEQPFGVLGVHTTTRRIFTNENIRFLKAVATVLCEAIERFRTEEALKSSREELRALAVRLQAAREEERANLAREIHDELSGSLTALRMDISLLPDRAAQDPRLLLEKLNSMTALIDSSLASMHDIVTGLRPVALDKFGLVAAIEWQASEFQKRSGIMCESGLPADELPLDPERSTAIFRIFQEALTNVVRHAGANKVTVVLRREAEGVMLAVTDNGKGIDEETIHARASLGLVGMRERALALGGTMEINRVPQQGTRVVVKIPL
jgi:PAS domain S-box-containing protein